MQLSAQGKNNQTIVEELAEFVQNEVAMNKCQDINDDTGNKEDACYHKIWWEDVSKQTNPLQNN